jgi:hypothetical protein
MSPGPSVDEHHWVPKCEGGREVSMVHKICHRALHARFSERELAREFATPEQVRADPVMARFISWVRKRPPDYIDWPKDMRRR